MQRRKKNARTEHHFPDLLNWRDRFVSSVINQATQWLLEVETTWISIYRFMQVFLMGLQQLVLIHILNTVRIIYIVFLQWQGRRCSTQYCVFYLFLYLSTLIFFIYVQFLCIVFMYSMKCYCQFLSNVVALSKNIYSN